MSRQAHGHTTAAWTGVVIAFVGFCISGVGMIMASPVIVIAGLVVVLAGGAAGLAMKAAGMGRQPDPKVEQIKAEYRALRTAQTGAPEAVTANA
ncbi:hypothetical protein E6W39_30970 [Kitasatospora acidiphila]|uniref:Uncharacterized protein n=1 Tax=Kitasatospora acidiphila TaxID=2567942 RepID=A0A540W9Z9_9ACTN|nr:HGxxPAAW family protein [Kitasatospora acidiphila]TQF05849.1 hypothetical protein E6W39_30970 [Kitasatospora acidiphila]